MKHHKVRTYKSAEPLDARINWPGRSRPLPPTRCARRRRRRDDRQPHHRQRRGGRRSLARPPVVAARAQAAGASSGTGRDGLRTAAASVSPEWAAWANGVAVRELDFHDTFLAADYSHPGDNIPPVLAVAQHCGSSGDDLIRGIAAAYEIQVDLVKGICLHEHKIDHIAHLGPSAAAGIGACSNFRPRRSIRRCSRRCMSPRPRGSRGRARSRAGRPMPRPLLARWRSKRSTARCAAKARRRRSTRARTASSPGS